jgi:tRNA pseudouridine38-40 synthase
MRHFLRLSYLGTRYAGWQKQPNAITVQETLEQSLATVLRKPIEITGCGRTDTGVHAQNYFAHFDFEALLPERFTQSMNSLLPNDMAVQDAFLVPGNAHARFDAVLRKYTYSISLTKNPFLQHTSWFLPQAHLINQGKMSAVCDILNRCAHFKPFCKSHSGLSQFECRNFHAHWDFSEETNQWILHIQANRFLRGMVRLIVGACLQCGKNQITEEEILTSMQHQLPLPKSWSVPPEGLTLTEVTYPFILNTHGNPDERQEPRFPVQEDPH